MSHLKPLLAFLVASACVLFLGYLFRDTTITSDAISDQAQYYDVGKREEIHRYTGYEEILVRYFTLPYDTSISVNQAENFVDIGYLIIIFVPIIILYILRRRKLYMCIFASVLIGYIIICLGNSLGVDAERVSRLDTMDKLETFVSTHTFSERPLDMTMATVHLAARRSYENMGLHAFINNVSGPVDWITYPLLFLLFLTIGYISIQYARERYPDISHLLLFTIVFTFYYMILAGGIVWYGYLLLFFIPILILWGGKQVWKKQNSGNYSATIPMFIRNAFFGLSAMFIMIGVVNRISGINLGERHQYRGLRMVEVPIYKYNLGLIEENEVINQFHPNLPTALEKINRNTDHLIYKSGTSLAYFINNQDRIFNDNQLENFRDIFDRLRTKEKITSYLKASGIKYILLDLNIPSMDKTPEKSLLAKFRLLQTYISDNPSVQLLATDRIVSIKDVDGQVKQYFHFMGKLVSNGNYAIFEIL